MTSADTRSPRDGFSLIEIIISILILAAMGGALIVVVRNQQLGDLTGNATLIKDRLADAEQKAVSAAQGTGWGIHFDNAGAAPSYALFSGNSYASPAITYFLPGNVIFVSPTSSAAVDVVFAKLTGAAAQTYTITIALRSNPALTKTITISPTGNVSAN